MKAPITQAQAWAVIAESAGWNAKELPEPNVPEGDWFVLDCYIKEYAQAYGAACAAHARRTALEEAAISCEAAMARIAACPKSGENEAVISCLSHRASVIRNLKEKKCLESIQFESDNDI